MTPARIELATFRFVIQHLNHCATAVPLQLCIFYNCGMFHTYKVPFLPRIFVQIKCFEVMIWYIYYGSVISTPIVGQKISLLGV